MVSEHERDASGYARDINQRAVRQREQRERFRRRRPRDRTGVPTAYGGSERPAVRIRQASRPAKGEHQPAPRDRRRVIPLSSPLHKPPPCPPGRDGDAARGGVARWRRWRGVCSSASRPRQMSTSLLRRRRILWSWYARATASGSTGATSDTGAGEDGADGIRATIVVAGSPAVRRRVDAAQLVDAHPREHLSPCGFTVRCLLEARRSAPGTGDRSGVPGGHAPHVMLGRGRARNAMDRADLRRRVSPRGPWRGRHRSGSSIRSALRSAPPSCTSSRADLGELRGRGVAARPRRAPRRSATRR